MDKIKKYKKELELEKKKKEKLENILTKEKEELKKETKEE